MAIQVNNELTRECLLKTRLYRAFAAERDEILRHKWLESEKAGHDIGFEEALVDWIIHHRRGWRKANFARLAAENHSQPLSA